MFADAGPWAQMLMGTRLNFQKPPRGQRPVTVMEKGVTLWIRLALPGPDPDRRAPRHRQDHFGIAAFRRLYEYSGESLAKPWKFADSQREESRKMSRQRISLIATAFLFDWIF